MVTCKKRSTSCQNVRILGNDPRGSTRTSDQIKMQLPAGVHFFFNSLLLLLPFYMNENSRSNRVYLVSKGIFPTDEKHGKIRGIQLYADLIHVFRGGTKMLCAFSMCCLSFPFCVYLAGHRLHAKCFWPPHSNRKCFTRLCLIWYDLPHWWQVNDSTLLKHPFLDPHATICGSVK